MTLFIKSFKRINGQISYKDKRPETIIIEVEAPIIFVYHSYNEPRIVRGTDIQVDDILEIQVLPD